MKYSVQGRIVLWEGGSLWAFAVPHAPVVRRSTGFHSHHAIQVTLAVDGAFAFSIGGEVVEGPVVVIAPDVDHAYDPVGQNAMLFIEPESRLGAQILRDLGGRSAARLAQARFADIAAGLAAVWRDPRPDDATLIAWGRDWAQRMGGNTAPHILDQRITRVLDKLSSDIDKPMNVGQAAEIACLSESRFSHLFVAEIGLPFRTYLLWRRMRLAVSSVASGTSLTSAAHEAGFADSAHFSRTFLRMFGVQASLLQMI